MIKRQIGSVILIITSIWLYRLVIGDSHSPLRTGLTVWFFLVCPGMAYIQSMRIEHGLTRWTLAIALSVTIDTLVALVMLYAGLWSARLGLIVIIAITLIGIGLHVVQSLADIRQSSTPDQPTEA